MTLSEIINRDEKEIFQEAEMIFVVKEYIKVRKNVPVDIELRRGLTSLFEINNLTIAFIIACTWFKENTDKIQVKRK